MVGGVPHSPSLPASTPNVLFYSHHSTGLGHLVRSLAVAGGLASRARVTLCCGGRVAYPDGRRDRPAHRIQPVDVVCQGPEGTSTGTGSLTLIAEIGQFPVDVGSS